MKLQSFIQEINKSLEDSSKKIIKNLGKVKGELSTLNAHACSLKQDLDNVQSELSKIQIENDAPTMSKLLQINELKTRMQQTSISLKEADNWSTLSKEMDSLIQTNDLDLIASKLICMEKSLKILTNVPDYVERVKKLNEFKAIFMQAINPKLGTLFNSHQKHGELERYIQIFNELDKIETLKEIHQEVVCHQLILEWQKTKNLTLKDTIIDWINSYFDLLNQTLSNQARIVHLFAPDAKECCRILVALLIDLFNKINDDLARNLNEFIDAKSNFIDLINSLILIKTLFDKLSKNVYGNLHKINSNLIVDSNQAKQLFILINTSYRLVLKKYFTIEQEMLKNNFAEIRSSSSAQLGEYVTKTFQIARDSEKRCYLLTNSVYLPKFIALIELNFNQSIDYFQTLLNSIQAKDARHVQQPDWNQFQTAFFYLQSIGDFTVQFDCFQQQIFNSWLDLKSKINGYESIASNFNCLYLNLDDQTTLQSIRIENCDQLFANCYRKLKVLCNEMMNLVLSIPINFISNHLAQIEQTFNQHNYLEFNQHENEEVFKLSLTPNEYITQIGQYLLTIPQHIEHFIIQENIALKCVFKHFDQTNYLGVSLDEVKPIDDVAEFFLNILIEKIVQLFIKRIHSINLHKAKDKLHLTIDIEYFNEVIDDLGLVSPHKNLIELIAIYLKK